jgi:hypothetical protein
MVRDEVLNVSVSARIVYPVGGTVVRCALVGAVLLGLSGCGSGQQPAPLPPVNGPAPQTTGVVGPTGPATPSPSVTPPSIAISGDPLAVYQSWWTAVEKALVTANASEPSLAQYGGNPLLGATQRRLIGLRAQQLVQVVHFGHSPQLAPQSTTRVDVLDCVTAPPGTYRDARTGAPRAPPGARNDIATHDSIRSVLQLIGGTWRVTAIQAGGRPCS